MLEFKKISEDTIESMKEAFITSEDFYPKAVEEINRLIPSDEIHILNSANSCLITVAECIPEPILVCDMGGWNGFIKSCELFGKNVEYLLTDNGVINIEILSNYLEEHDVNSLYITSLAGYTALQPLNKIHELCNLHEVLLINDISGSVGNEEITSYGDILISSTGSPKIVNIENGGFICKKNAKIDLNKHLLKSLKADNITCAGIANEIPKAPEILNSTVRLNRYLKEKLNSENIPLIHPEHEGLNTIILSSSKSKAKKLAYNLRQHLEIDGNIVTVGPNYNRIKKPCVIIEVKNLNTYTLTFEDLDFLADIIIKEFENIEK